MLSCIAGLISTVPAPAAEAPAPPANPPAAPAPTPATPPAPTPPPAAAQPATPGPLAQQGVPAGPITLDQAIQIAYRNNGNVTIALEDVTSARYRVTEARAATLPNLSGGVTYGGSGVNDLGSLISDLPQQTVFNDGLMPGVQVKATPFDSGQTRLAVREAQANVRVASAGLDLEQLNLAFDVTNDYYEQLRAQQLAKLSEQQVAQAQQQLDFVDARISVGAEAPVNRYQVEVTLENARVTLLANQNQVRLNGAALRDAMGLPTGPPLQLIDVTPTTSGASLPAAPPLDQAVSEATVNHPQIREDVAAVEAAQSDLRLQALRRRPILTTTGSYNFTPEDARTKSQWSVLAGITMPIWDAGVTRARERESRATLVGAQARTLQTRVDITTQVQQALLNIENAKERVDASAIAVESATRNLEAVNARYQQGLATVIDLTTAQLNDFLAQENAISALYDYYIAQAQLRHAVGR